MEELNVTQFKPRWSEIENKDHFVGVNIMGWTPVLCDGEIGELPISPDGWFCQECGYSGSWGEKSEHEQLPKRYTENIELALQVVEKAQEHWKGETSLDIRLQSHGEHRYLVDFLYPVLHTLSGDPGSVYTSYVETAIVRDSCNIDNLAETICFVVAQALGVVAQED